VAVWVQAAVRGQMMYQMFTILRLVRLDESPAELDGVRHIHPPDIAA